MSTLRWQPNHAPIMPHSYYLPVFLGTSSHIFALIQNFSTLAQLTFEPDYSSLGVRETVLHIIGYLVASGASIGCELPSSPNLWPVVRNLNVSRNYQISPREHNFPHPHTWPFRSTALSSQSRCRCLRPNGKPKMML